MLIVLGFCLKHNNSSQVAKERKNGKMLRFLVFQHQNIHRLKFRFYLIDFFRTVVEKFRDYKKDGHVGIILRISREKLFIGIPPFCK